MMRYISDGINDYYNDLSDQVKNVVQYGFLAGGFAVTLTKSAQDMSGLNDLDSVKAKAVGYLSYYACVISSYLGTNYLVPGFGLLGAGFVVILDYLATALSTENEKSYAICSSLAVYTGNAMRDWSIEDSIIKPVGEVCNTFANNLPQLPAPE